MTTLEAIMADALNQVEKLTEIAQDDPAQTDRVLSDVRTACRLALRPEYVKAGLQAPTTVWDRPANEVRSPKGLEPVADPAYDIDRDGWYFTPNGAGVTLSYVRACRVAAGITGSLLRWIRQNRAQRPDVEVWLSRDSPTWDRLAKLMDDPDLACEDHVSIRRSVNPKPTQKDPTLVGALRRG